MTYTEGVEIQVGEKWAVVSPEDAEWAQARKWHLHPDGYARAYDRELGRHIYLHRAVLARVHGEIPSGFQTDHLNRDRLDCRRENLRLATHLDNARNLSSKGGSSRFRGVFWHKDAGRWATKATVDGQDYHLGYFASEEHAARVAKDFRMGYMEGAVD